MPCLRWSRQHHRPEHSFHRHLHILKNNRLLLHPSQHLQVIRPHRVLPNQHRGIPLRTRLLRVQNAL